MAKKNQGCELIVLGAGRPLRIGEDHTWHGARSTVMCLLSAGIVRNLFVEVRRSYEEKHHILTNAIGKRAGGVDAMIPILKAIGVQFQCIVSLEAVIATAILRNVPVHFADGGHGTSRNEFIAEQFTNIAGLQPRGSVLLFGGAHFDGAAPTLQALIPGMDWIDYPQPPKLYPRP